MKNKWIYLLLFVVAVCAIVYLSLPSEKTLVEMSRDDGNVDRTVQLLRQRYEREPDDDQIALELAEAYTAVNQPDRAVGILTEFNRRHPGSARIQRPLAMAMLDKDNLEEALAVLPESRRDKPFLERVSAYYQKRGDLLNAEKALLEADKDSESAALWMKVAGWRRDRYDMEGQGAALRRVLELEPDNRETWEAYFLNRSWQLDAPEAVRAAAKVETFRPLDRLELQTVQSLQLTMGDTGGALASSRKIAFLPDATSGERIEYGLLLYREDNSAAGDAEMLRLLDTMAGDPAAQASVIGFLQTSAFRDRDLELALRLVALPAEPAAARANKLLAAELTMEAGRIVEAERLVAELLADPDASADVLQMAFLIAYRRQDYASMPGLLARLDKAGHSIDDLLFLALENNRTQDDWRGDAEKSPRSVPAWTGFTRAAARSHDAAGVEAGIEKALPLLDDRDVVDGFALFESMLYLANAGPSGEKKARIEKSLPLAEKLLDSPLGKSRWFLLMAANAFEGDDRMDRAEELWRRVAKAHPDDPWSRLGIIRSATLRGDEKSVAEVLAEIERQSVVCDAAEIRTIVYACLDMNTRFRQDDPERAGRWLEKARDMMVSHRDILPQDEPENIALLGAIYERMEDWKSALACWRALAAKRPDSFDAALGVARAAIGLKQPDIAWQALRHGDSLLGKNQRDRRLQLVWQFFAVAEETPRDNPQRARRMEWAEEYAARLLREGWDQELASSLVWRALEKRDWPQARSLLERMDKAPLELNAAVAEYLFANGEKDEALAAAMGAVSTNDRKVLLRLAWLFSQMDEKNRAGELVTRAANAPGEETSEFLLELADVYGALDNRRMQYRYIEKRARMGGEKEWIDAIDRRTWGGDLEGAIGLVNEARDLYPASEALFERKLLVLADSNRPGLVVDTFEKELRRDPAVEDRLAAESLAALGVAYDDLRLSPKARRFFRRSLEKEPDNKRGSVGYARLQRRDGNLGGAITQLRKYTSGHPDDAWGWLELANTRSTAQLNGTQEYRKVVELTNPDAKGEIAKDVRAARAVALRQLGREREARALLQNTIVETIDNPDIACDYAQMMLEVGKYDEAERVLRETVKRFPNHVWAYRLEATSLVRRKKYDLAVARLKEALTWAPSDGEVQRDLAFAAQLWERMWMSQKGWLSAGSR